MLHLDVGFTRTEKLNVCFISICDSGFLKGRRKYQPLGHFPQSSTQPLLPSNA